MFNKRKKSGIAGRPRMHDSGIRVQIRPTVHPFVAKCLERQGRPAGHIIDELVSKEYDLELK